MGGQLDYGIYSTSLINEMQFEKDIQSDHKDLFHTLREFLLSYDGVVEVKKTRITTYSNSKGGICHMRTMPYGIDIGFLKGVKLEDNYNLLEGSGKTMRVLPLTSFDSKIVKYYMDQAVLVNLNK